MTGRRHSIAAAEDSSRFFLTSDGVRLHYTDTGSGDPIILVPGWKCSVEIWQHQTSHFRQGYRVLALDPRSQGRSEIALEGNYLERRARDILELVQHVGQQPRLIVGHSLAMWEVLSLLEQFGEDVAEAIVLVDARMENRVTSESLSGWMESWSAVQRDPAGFTDQFVRGLFATPQPEEFIRTLIEFSLITPGSTAFAIGANALLVDWDWWPTLERAVIPLLYVAWDRYSDLADEMRVRIPRARVEVFADAGHALFVDEVDRFNRLLTAFLSSVPGCRDGLARA